MDGVLRTCNLSAGYKGNPIISIPDVSLHRGRVVALVGQNGIGKSTLLRTFTRELPPVSGEAFIGNKAIDKMKRREFARNVAVVTTDRDISSGLLVREIVSMGRHPHTDIFSRYSDEDYEVIEQAMDNTGILHKSSCCFGELSDGERQKVMIARALAQQTPVMILDEPFSFLDTASRIEILNLLKKLAVNKNTAILFSSHDVAQALRMADFIWLISPDRKFYEGTPQSMIADNTIAKLFDKNDVIFDPAQNDFVNK